jgi:predicted enzyme related to lactoylglutathione lyase
LFDLLTSADLLVDDATEVVSSLNRHILLPEPRPSWHQLWPGWGFEAYWCRVRSDLTVSPTRLQVIAPHGDADPAITHPGIRMIYDSQEPRRVRSHSTPIAVPDLEEIRDRLVAQGCAFRVDPPDSAMEFGRLWVGRRERSDAGLYDPSVDGGLMLEFIPTAALQLPAGAAEAPAPQLTGDGSLVRVERKSFLVRSLGHVLDALKTNFGWTPSRVLDDGSARRAVFGFAYRHSADIEVIEPHGTTVEAEALGRWGPGPYQITLSVDDLDEANHRMLEAGTKLVHRSSHSPFRSVEVDTAQTGGAPIRLVDFAEWQELARP